MDRRLTPERKDALVNMFTKTADMLTNGDALAIIEILERACNRASAELEEDMLRALIEGNEIEEGPASD